MLSTLLKQKNNKYEKYKAQINPIGTIYIKWIFNALSVHAVFVLVQGLSAKLSSLHVLNTSIGHVIQWFMAIFLFIIYLLLYHCLLALNISTLSVSTFYWLEGSLCSVPRVSWWLFLFCANLNDYYWISLVIWTPQFRETQKGKVWGLF